MIPEAIVPEFVKRQSFIELDARARAQSLMDTGSWRELVGPFDRIESPWLPEQGIAPQFDDGCVVLKGPSLVSQPSSLLWVIKTLLANENQACGLRIAFDRKPRLLHRLMVMLVFVMFAYVRALFVSRHKLALEAVALRQQLAVFKRKQSRPKLRRLDRLCWIALRSLWPGWTESLILVKPETVVSWHRTGFRLFWRWRSRFRHPGRPKISDEYPPVDSSHQDGQPKLGSTSHSWRITPAGVRDFRADRITISTSPEASPR